MPSAAVIQAGLFLTKISFPGRRSSLTPIFSQCSSSQMRIHPAEFAYPFPSSTVLTMRNLPAAAEGTVHNGHPQVRQKAFSLGCPLPVSVRVYLQMLSWSALTSTSAVENLAICVLDEYSIPSLKKSWRSSRGVDLPLDLALQPQAGSGYSNTTGRLLVPMRLLGAQRHISIGHCKEPASCRSGPGIKRMSARRDSVDTCYRGPRPHHKYQCSLTTAPGVKPRTLLE